MIDFAELPDQEFARRWRALSDFDKIEMTQEDLRFFGERYDSINPDKPIKRDRPIIEEDKRGNGKSHDYDPGPLPEYDDTPPTVKSNVIDWATLTGEPPGFPWIMDHWLSWHPTLLAGRGSIGKSLLIQQLGTQLAAGKPTWCASQGVPLRVLYWACEDDRDQLWRRQHNICRNLKLPFTELGNLYIDARYGLENTLMDSVYGKPAWTPMIETLRQQVNDLNIDILALDNLGHTFGANENNRHDVTKFLNGIAGLVEKRPFCPIVLGHPSKGIGSEYSGSTAWENAVRMRWYLDDRLPDQASSTEDKPDPDYRVLAKRKTNYTIKDYVQFRFSEGMLVADMPESGDPGLMHTLRKRKARRIVIESVNILGKVNIFGSNATGRNYLPHVIMENKLADGLTKAELGEAMRDMIMTKELELCEVGKNAARRPVIGLKTNVSI